MLHIKQMMFWDWDIVFLMRLIFKFKTCPNQITKECLLIRPEGGHLYAWDHIYGNCT